MGKRIKSYKNLYTKMKGKKVFPLNCVAVVSHSLRYYAEVR